MVEQLARVVDTSIQKIQRMKREMETTYLSLVELFPRLMAETDESSKTSQESLNALLGLLQAGGRAEIEKFLADTAKVFEILRERDKGFLVSINSGIEHISALDEIINRVRLDSEEMEIVSLNALTAALKSGSAGRAFSVITEELKQLSSRTIATTVDISFQGQRLLSSFRSLGGTLTELAAMQEGLFQEVRSTLADGFSSLEERVQGAVVAFRSLSEEASRVKRPITGIMQGVQIQDTLRQSMDHVVLSLQEIFKDTDASQRDELLFASAVADLSISVLNDVMAQINGGVESMSEHIDEVVSIVENVDKHRQDICDSQDIRDLGSTSGMEKVESYLKLKNQTLSMGRDLSSQVQKLNDSFKILHSLLGRFQNIVVASRIEIARTRSLAVVSNTVASMIEITESLGRDVGSATNLTKTFIKTASAEILSFDHAQEKSDKHLMLSMGRIEHELDKLTEDRLRGQQTISSFRIYTSDFLALIQTSRSTLDQLSGLRKGIGRLKDDLGSLKTKALEEVETLGGENTETYTIRSERLRLIVERLTTFARKKAAGAPGDSQEEKGVDSGEATLC